MKRSTKKPIANYSTTVPTMRSIGEIQGILVAHSATAIMVNFDGKGETLGLSFIIPTKFGDVPFRLPANIDKVEAVLNNQRVRTTVSRKTASDVAWRILKDWVRAQVAILETEMVTIDQVFLPYMDVGKGRTLYEHMVSNQLQLPSGKEE